MFRPSVSKTVLVTSFLAAILTWGCEVRLKPVEHVAEYRSGIECASSPQECPWSKLNQEAALTALVNCLLAGANVLRMEQRDVVNQEKPRVVAAIKPKFGYEHVTGDGDGTTCPTGQTVCRVVSRHESELTWAKCETRPLQEGELRGGTGLARADRLTESVVVTGSLTKSSNEFAPPSGLDGPDHFYTFTLNARSRVEVAVAANSSAWSGVAGLVQSAWQPDLFLLSAGGDTIQKGYVYRAGVTALFPVVLEPGTYYVVIDGSSRELARGKGLYRLYIGLGEDLLGPLPQSH